MKSWPRRILVVVLALAATAVVAAQRGGRGAAAAASLVIEDTTLIDGTGAAPRPHVTIVIHDGRIARIGAAADPSGEPATTPIVDGRGLFAIPGLIDAHVHLSGSTWQQRSDQLAQALRGGVTSVFDLAGDARINGDLARAVATGEIQGPHIYYTALMAGPPFFHDPRVLAASQGYAAGTAPWMQAITPETDMVRAVAAAKGTGATAIKLYAALDAATVTRIAAEAHRQGLRVVAHATTFPAKPSDLIAAGVDMLAHAAYLVWEGSPPSTDYPNRAKGDFAHVAADAPEIERVLQAMKSKDIALNPTLWIFAEGQPKDDLSPLRIAWMNAVTRRAAEIGVPIVAGTDNLLDARVDTLPILHRELEQLVTGAKMTPMQAIVSATRNAAHAMGIDRTVGTVEPDRAADLLLLAADPTIDIRATREIRVVVAGGRVVVRAGG